MKAAIYSQAMRLSFMKFLLFFCFIIAYSSASSQKCTANIPLKAIVCKGVSSDSVTIICIKNSYGLMAPDSNLVIESYLVTAGGQGFDDDIHQAPNQGDAFGPAPRRIINMLRPGSYIEFSCIKAKHKKNNSITYVLQPLFFELR
jgi:hypothetical protein